MDHDGMPVSPMSGDVPFDDSSAAEALSALRRWQIEKRHGTNWCLYEDGSYVVGAIDNHPEKNGVFCDIPDVCEADADLIYIAPDGTRTVI